MIFGWVCGAPHKNKKKFIKGFSIVFVMSLGIRRKVDIFRKKRGGTSNPGVKIRATTGLRGASIGRCEKFIGIRVYPPIF